MGLGNMVSALCGVTEPTIYSIALTNIRLFAAGMIGGGVAGGILGALGGKMYVYAGDGIFRIPAMINPKGIDISFYGFIICAVVAFVIAAVVSFIFTTNSKDEAEKIEITEKTIDKKETRQKNLCTSQRNCNPTRSDQRRNFCIRDAWKRCRNQTF